MELPEGSLEFLNQSNLIEGVDSTEADNDAMLAFIWLFTEGKGLPNVGLRNVKQVHKILMNKLHPRIAGTFRTCGVSIGGTNKPFVSTAEFNRQVKNWLAKVAYFFLRMEKHPEQFSKKAIEKILKELHIDFEEIHPFEDGNGRVGRLLYNYHRTLAGLPVHIIHVGKEQQEYYQWFRERRYYENLLQSFSF